MLIFVPLTQVDDNPFQRRTEYGDIAELAERIVAASPSYPETFGLMQVPRGRLLMQNSRYPDGLVLNSEQIAKFGVDKHLIEDSAMRVQLAFGHRRLRAFRLLWQEERLGYTDGRFPVHIDPLSDQQMIDAVWAENYERKDITAVEQAELIQLKLQQLGPDATHKDIGAAWGLSRPVISNRLRLLELPAEVQQANREGKLSERQALALAPIIEIDALVNGRVEWGENINMSWGMPAGAGTVIERVLAEPGKFTSDDLRSHARKMAENAGKLLPDCIARHDYGALPGVEQPQCKGCRFRIDQRCLDTACWAHKVEVWPDIAVEKFSQETGIPVSDREEDFSVGNYGIHHHILKLYEAGITDGMVCGWAVGGSAARPLGGSWESDGMGKDGRAGIALGWRGKLPPLPEETAVENNQPHYDMPLPDQIEMWKDEASKIQLAAERALLDAVTDALSYQVAEFDLLQALIFHRDNEWIDEPGKLIKQIAKFLIDKGSGVVWTGNAYESVELLQGTLRRAGLDANLLGDGDEMVNKTAVLILARWYSIHNGYFWEENGREVMEWIAAFRALPRADDSPLAADIERAWRHIEQKLAAEGDGPDLDDYRLWTIHENGSQWTCPNCFEDAVSWQRGEGSCAECGNEMLIQNNQFWAKEIKCHHCRQRAANVTNEPYCAKCWQGELTDPLKCPACKATSTLPKSATDNESEECWACHETFLMNQWRGKETAEPEDGSYSFTEEMETFVQGVETAVSELANELTMTEVAIEWLRTYQDDKGRTWQDLTSNQTHHANSPCYQSFVAAFPAEKEPKLLLKQARAQLERETAVSEEVL